MTYKYLKGPWWSNPERYTWTLNLSVSFWRGEDQIIFGLIILILLYNIWEVGVGFVKITYTVTSWQDSVYGLNFKVLLFMFNFISFSWTPDIFFLCWLILSFMGTKQEETIVTSNTVTVLCWIFLPYLFHWVKT